MISSTSLGRSRNEKGVSSSTLCTCFFNLPLSNIFSTGDFGRSSQLDYEGSARQDSYGLYDGHQSSVGYGGSKTYSSLGGSEAAGTYSSYANDYLSSGADIGGGSYSSLYSSRNMGSGYLPGSGSRSYY